MPSQPLYAYRPDVLRALARHGLAPRGTTRPSTLRDHLRALYRFELRRLKAARLDGACPRAAFAPRVAELRQRYALVSLPLASWVTTPLPPDEAARDQAGPPC
jgi:hypothetical protein